MVDETTTDISNNKKAVHCFRWVFDDLIVDEEFVRPYGIVQTEAQTLVNI